MDILYCDNCGSKVPRLNDTQPKTNQGKVYCPSCGPLFEQTSSALLQIAVPESVYEQATTVAPVVQEPARAVTRFYFCETCGKRITDKQLEEGLGRDKKLKGFYCEDCAQGVGTIEFAALQDPQIEARPPRASPAPFKPPVPAPAPAPARAPAHFPSPPLTHVRPVRNPPATAIKRGAQSAIIPWAAGGVTLCLALYMIFGSSKQAPAPTPVPAPEIKVVQPQTPPQRSEPPPSPVTPPPPPKSTSVVAPAPNKPPVTVSTEKPTLTSSNTILDTITVDFQKEAPPPGSDGFEAAANPPPGSPGHPMRVQARPHGYLMARLDANALIANSAGQKTKAVFQATATSVLHLRVYGDHVGGVGASIVEVNTKYWHEFRYLAVFTTQHAWTTLEIPLKDLKDDHGQSVGAGLQIWLVQVLANGTQADYSLWIDELSVLPQPTPASEKPR